ncbi:suppressor of fused domain protein [Duganella sp. HSC-15S17]|uniref:Suppressor of fused domain protein n=1 Tax=Duganella violaceipulchra TaxID=2849652 RepID=A0AA41HDE7_9BURK|nr:suppressor of fused domain protein [Duganella violaceicalia]
MYVTSGASNPWETEPLDCRPDEYSWLGVEFVIEIPSQADWPINTLRRLLAYHLLVIYGNFRNYYFI